MPPHEENSVSNVADNSQSDTLQSDNVVLGPITLRCLVLPLAGRSLPDVLRRQDERSDHARWRRGPGPDENRLIHTSVAFSIIAVDGAITFHREKAAYSPLHVSTPPGDI